MGLFDSDDDERPERLATRIRKLRLDEVSGVDSPANELPGWLLRKNAAGGADARHAELPAVVSAIREGLRKELAPIADAIGALNERLDHIEGS